MIAFDERYVQQSDKETSDRICAHKQQLGSDLLILAHHYQPESTFQFADRTGDSLKLSDQARSARQAKYIIFCGVHFMAEVARMLCGADQSVILPDLSAGCPMADMVTADQLDRCWSDLASRAPGRKVVPVVYINSSAAVKAFCGRHDGAVCTSGNASQVMRWALSRGDIVLFAPDEHLGRNSAYGLGHSLDQMVVYNPRVEHGGLGDTVGEDIRFVLWAGFCNVHVPFTVEDVAFVRSAYPGVRVVVHPECPFEVVQASDEAGSTEYIINTIANSAEGSTWAVGTERDMVDRLARRHASRRTVVNLSRGYYCPTMKRCTPARLLWVLDSLAAGEVVNEIEVPSHIRDQAIVAIERMLAIRRDRPKEVKG